MIDIEMDAKEIEEGQAKDETEEEVRPVEIDGNVLRLASSNLRNSNLLNFISDEKEDGDAPVSLQSNKVLLDSFLTTLSSCVNREMIDSAAIDFSTNLNTKNNRKKLVRQEPYLKCYFLLVLTFDF